jgi:outer membrane receptor protein involved in Fe transport
MDDRLKFTGSIRYDKAQNYDGNVSPRVSLVYSGGESRRHNFRGSFQTGFRNPTTQDQYIGFNVGSAILLGSIDNLTRYSEVLAVGTPVGQHLLVVKR